MLDLGSCAGIGADGYARHFEVTAVDVDPVALGHNPHPHMVADMRVIAADIDYLQRFDFIHASPPCQGTTRLRSLADAQGAGPGRSQGVSIATMRALLAASGVPYVIENVEGAPLTCPVRLCGSSFGLRVRRHRLFEASADLPLIGTPCRHAWQGRPWGVYGSPRDKIPSGGRTVRSIAAGHQAMGITRDVPWKYLAEAIPPAYTDFIGGQVAAHLATLGVR